MHGYKTSFIHKNKICGDCTLGETYGAYCYIYRLRGLIAHNIKLMGVICYISPIVHFFFPELGYISQLGFLFILVLKSGGWWRRVMDGGQAVVAGVEQEPEPLKSYRRVTSLENCDFP